MKESTNTNKSDLAKEAQIVRFKERIRSLEDQVRVLQDENELLYGKLSEGPEARQRYWLDAGRPEC